MRPIILNRKTPTDKHFLGLLIIMAVLVIIVAIIKPTQFYNISNLETMLSQFPQYGILTLGVMLAMMLGGIDLSVVGVANLATICAALFMRQHITEITEPSQAVLYVVIACVIALCVGFVCGMANGLLISLLDVPAILATLGSFSLYTGTCIILTGGSILSRLPKTFGEMAGMQLFGVVLSPLIVFVLCCIFVSVVLNKAALGKKILFVGANMRAAIFSGLNVNKTIITVYTISGILAAIGGLVMMGRMNSAKADFGSSYTMQCILIVVLGGVDPYGGSGKMRGVVVAILILQIISSALNMFSETNNFYKLLVWGLVLLIVMVANSVVRKRELGR